MRLSGQALLESNPQLLKFIFNREAVNFGMFSLQHRELGSNGLTYKDGGGNAIAGLIVGGKIEIRGHSVLKPNAEDVKLWIAKIRETVGSEYFSSLAVDFQGKNIIPAVSQRSL